MEVTKMKLKNNVVFIFSLALVFVFGSSMLLNGAKYSKYDDFRMHQLKKKAAEKGFLRVIVKLDVPDIEELTAQSTSFKTGITDTTYIQGAFDADLALEEAISITGNTVLHRLNGMNYNVIRTFSTIPFIGLAVTAQTLDKLNSIPEVLGIVEDEVIPLPETRETPVDDNMDVSEPKLRESTLLVGADVAWSFGYNGSGWYVAILDTGILTSHEMFQGKNIVEHCFASGPIFEDKTHGDCPNGQIEMSGPGSAAHYEPRFGHGSHVAGIAAGNNQFSQYGVARGADIIAVQVFTYFPEDSSIGSWVLDQMAALQYIYSQRNNYKIAAANLSLGGYTKYTGYCDTDYRQTAITNLRAAGIATTVSSGNEANCDGVSSPACVSTALAINAVDKSDNEYSNGNWHDVMVDLMAPGVRINSAGGRSDLDYGNRTGTSMAAPHVAGAWAIMKQYDPNMTIDEILTLLQDTGKMITSSRCEGRIPKARINIGDALTTLLVVAPPKNLYAVQKINQSLLMTEYINEITWESNPYNDNRTISHYNIYLVQGEQLNLLTQASSSTFTYLHRRAEKEQEVTYAAVAVDADGQESPPAYFTLEFNQAFTVR